MSSSFRFSPMSVIFLLAAAFAVQSQAQSPAQTKAGQVVPGKYIVMLKKGGDPDQMLAKHDARKARTFRKAINGFAGELSDSAVQKLKSDPSVLSVEPDRIITGNDIESNPPWSLDRIDQRELPLDLAYNYSSDGSGVTVYMIDTGIRYDHAEFGGRARFGYDAVDASTGSSQAGLDCNGHGTHTAATVGGATYGVAKGVQLVAVRVLQCNNTGTTSDLIAGLDWVATHHSGLSVANASIGAPFVSLALDTAVENLVGSGVAVAVPANNYNGDACQYSPARAPSAITVGASDNLDARAWFSDYGECVDIFAPGVDILSAGINSPTDSLVLSGTSMAAPHVAGAAALYLEQNPGASPQQIRDALVAASTKNIVTSAKSTNNHLLYVGPNVPPQVPVGYRMEQWGAAGDLPVVGRFFARAPDEALRDDIGVYRPSTHEFWLKKSGSSDYVSYKWGVEGDIPVTGDFLGKGTTQVGVFRPSDGTWYILDPIDGTFQARQWGQAGDIPFTGNFLGSGHADIAVFRPSTGMIFIENFLDGGLYSRAYQWGMDGDIPVVADFLGSNGYGDQIAMFRPSDGNWYILEPRFGGKSGAHWGASGDLPVPGRYKSYYGAERTQLAVYRSSSATFYVLDTATNHTFTLQWGGPGDIPVVGDFDGSGRVTPTVFRPEGGQWWIHEGF